MKVDRTAFLLLSSSIAGGCQARDARRAEPSHPVTTIYVQHAPSASSSPGAPAEDPKPVLARCDDLPSEQDCEGEGIRSFCERYATYFRPEVADKAIACMKDRSGGDACDHCVLTQCGQKALQAADGEPDPECYQVASACEGMESLCEQYSRGLNEAGRRRFRTCLIENCGIGVRYCLWDSSSTPCTEGGGFRHFDF